MYARKFVPEKMKSFCIHMITSPIERQLVYKILSNIILYIINIYFDILLHDQYVKVLKSVHYICLLIISLVLLTSFITWRLYLILFITRPLFLWIRCTATGYRQWTTFVGASVCASRLFVRIAQIAFKLTWILFTHCTPFWGIWSSL